MGHRAVGKLESFCLLFIFVLFRQTQIKFCINFINEQDRFDDVSSYVHKGIEFCEKYEEFCKKRCAIENNYAKHLRKLIEVSEPKKKDNEENE